MVQEEQVRQRAGLHFCSPLHASTTGELLKLDHISFLDTRYASFTPPSIHHHKSVLVSRQIPGRQMMLGDRSAEGFWEIPCTGHIKSSVSLDNLKLIHMTEKYDETW